MWSNDEMKSKVRCCFNVCFSGLVLNMVDIHTDDATQTYTYHLTSHLTYTPSNMTTLALIKRGPTLDPLSPLATQIHILNLFGGDETPYESLHAVVRDGVKPWFDAFVGARGGGKDGVSKMGEYSPFMSLASY